MLSSVPVLPLPAPPSDGNLGPLPLAQLDDLQQQQQQPSDKPDTDELLKSGAVATSVATHTRTIGIIHPPPDIRNIVDKTAQFVAKNGPEFEKRIVANNAGNAKFNFLTPLDPYHAYYQHRLSEFRTHLQSSPQLADPSSAPDMAPHLPEAVEAAVPVKSVSSAQFRPVQKVLEPPEAEQYTVRLPDGITGEELDMIKLTAQFVARNGKSFLTGLTSREINNPQFHFLKPTHSMFMFFTALADAYSKVLMPPKGLTEKVRRNASDVTVVLERCLHRLEWERSQEQARQEQDDKNEQERMQMAMIDWHDFVVVETIEFADDEGEELPPPMTLDEVVHRSKMSSAASAEEDEVLVEQVKEMEMDDEEAAFMEEGMRASTAAQEEEEAERKREEEEEEEERVTTIAMEPEVPMRIVKNWKRPEERLPVERDASMFVVSPITGELIPVSEMSEHMRISLIDPKYKEQKDRMFAKLRETTLAQDDEISRNIVGLARTRPDIFGTTEEEVSNAVKAEIERVDEHQQRQQQQQMMMMQHQHQVIWDGHSGSITRAAVVTHAGGLASDMDVSLLTGPHPLLQPSVRPLPPPPGLALNLPRVQPARPVVAMMGVSRPMLAPPPPVLMASRAVMAMPPPPPGSQFPPPVASMMMHGFPPPPPPPEEAPPLPEEPEPKKQRLEDSLIPEDQFLSSFPGPAVITILVGGGSSAGAEGNHEVLDITVQSLLETVGSLKEKIAGEVQLPANKQKLSGLAGFLKDNMSLAHYNVAPGHTLTLSLRERGGRKR